MKKRGCNSLILENNCELTNNYYLLKPSTYIKLMLISKRSKANNFDS